MTTSSTASDDKFVKLMTCLFQWLVQVMGVFGLASKPIHWTIDDHDQCVK